MALCLSIRLITYKRTLGVVLFEGFELLDVFGPLEMFGGIRKVVIT